MCPPCYSIHFQIFAAHKQHCAVAFFNRSLLYQNEGNIDQALADINLALKEDRTNSTFLNNRALLLRKKNDYIASIADVNMLAKIKKKKKSGMHGHHAGSMTRRWSFGNSRSRGKGSHHIEPPDLHGDVGNGATTSTNEEDKVGHQDYSMPKMSMHLRGQEQSTS